MPELGGIFLLQTYATLLSLLIQSEENPHIRSSKIIYVQFFIISFSFV
jgi:hypothetical protein